jgi:hypothetical protein
VFSGDSQFVNLYEVQDGLENAREIEQLPHATKATADPSEGFHVTSIGWNVSSLQTNNSAPGG